MTAQVLQEGQLDAIPVVDLIVAALRAPSPAALEIEREGSRRRFCFSEGKLRSLDVSGGPQSLVKMLIKRKKVGEADGEVLINEAGSTGDHIIEVVARTASISHADLQRECSLWATLLLVQSVGWNSGSYRIEQIPPPEPTGGLELDVAVAAALIKGVYKKIDVDEVRAMLGPYGPSVPTPSREASFSTMELDLDARQLEFFHSIDGRRTVDEMLEFSHLSPDDTGRMLFSLHRLGMLSFEDPDLEEQREAGASARQVEAQSEDSEASPVDLSSIRFSRGSRASEHSSTFHSVTPGSKESLGAQGPGPVSVGVGVGHSGSVDEPGPAAPSEGLSDLFSGMDLEAPPPTTQPAPEFGAEPLEAPPQPEPETADGPPGGAGPTIEAEEWMRLTTKDKDRVRLLRSELNRLKKANYFEFFALTHESPEAAIKKAFFQSAKRYHPDSLLDESDVYRRLAEALFAEISEAWETLSDEELRDKYVRKHIFGEKDENDLALEKVHQILDAEASFKNGLRLLNAGKLQDALRHLKTAHENYDEEGEYLAYYAFVLFRTQRGSDSEKTEEALEMLQRATELNPNSPKVYHLLGKVYLLLNNAPQAKKYLRKTLKLQSDNSEAIRDYRHADSMGSGKGSEGSSKSAKGGFFSRFGRKKQAAPKEKSEEEKFIDNLDMDLDF